MSPRDKMRSRQAIPVIRTLGPIEALANLPGTAPAVATNRTMRELIALERANCCTTCAGPIDDNGECRCG